MNKVLLLIVTGMPGLHKLIFFFLIEHFVALNVFGKFSNDYYIVQMFLIFNALGFIGMLMIKIPKYTTEYIKEYIQKVIITFLFFAILSIPFFIILQALNLIFDSFDSFILLLGMGGNLLVRYYYLALKKYTIVFIYDLYVLIILSLGIYYLIHIVSPIILVALGYLSSFFLFCIIKKVPLNYHFIDMADLKKSFDISTINFLSAGVYLLLIPLVNKKLGIDYAGLLGIISVISTTMLLIPRALSLYFLPDLSKHITNKNKLLSMYKNFSFINITSLLLLLLLSLVILFCIEAYFHMKSFNLEYSELLYILFMLSVLVSQLALPASNLLLALEKTKLLTKVNFYLVLCYFFSYMLLSMIKGIDAYSFVYITIIIMIIGNFIRFLILNYYVNINLKNLEEV